MFDAQLLFPGASGATLSVYGPWFPKRGDSAVFTMEVVQVNSCKLTVDVFTKNSEDTGDGAAAGGSAITRSTVGRTSGERTSLKELVRYKFTVTGQTPATTDWVLLRMVQPAWFNTVSA